MFTSSTEEEDNNDLGEAEHEVEIEEAKVTFSEELSTSNDDDRY